MAGTSRKQAAELALAAKRRKRDLDRALGRIRRLRGEGMVAFDDLWEEVAAITEGEVPLWRADFKSVRELVARELPGETVRSVARNVLVARSFSPTDEERHGIGFLEEVALYAKQLAGATEVPRAIDLDRMTLQVRAGRRTARKPLREATIEEVRRARREHAGGRRRRANESPVIAALRAAFARRASLRRIALRATSGGVSFGDVPFAALGTFARAVALASEKLPAPAPARPG